MTWQAELADGFSARFKRFQKKYEKESQAMLSNLETYLKAIQEGVHPQHFKAGFIHLEPDGIKAIDQKGADMKKPAQTRLYVFPEIERSLLHIITVGDKQDQGADVNLARTFVRRLKEGGRHD